jgi:hypothetical protein
MHLPPIISDGFIDSVAFSMKTRGRRELLPEILTIHCIHGPYSFPAPLSFPPLKSTQPTLVPVKIVGFSLSEWEPTTPIASANCEDVGRLKSYIMGGIKNLLPCLNEKQEKRFLGFPML